MNRNDVLFNLSNARIFYRTTKSYIKEYGFLSFVRKYKKQLLDTGLDFIKTASKNVVHKTGDALVITDALTNSNNDKIMKPDKNSKNVEEIILPLEKRDEILNKVRKVL